MKKTIALIVLDGFGYSKKMLGNAVYLAKMPYYNNLISSCPNALIRASGTFVGLKPGQMGNSETGHLNLGAGRIVKQDLTIIDDAIDNGEFYKNKELVEFFKNMKKNNQSIHIMGLISNGGIHSHINHLYATLKMAKMFNLTNVYIHCFTDGRDTKIDEGIKFVKELKNQIKSIGIGKIATISGRFYAMDREKLYNRTQLAYNAMVYGKGEFFDNPVKAIKSSYENGVYDEFIKPIVITKDSKPIATIKNGDGIICFNFRKDRIKQIAEVFTDKNFKEFKTEFIVKNYLNFTSVGDEFNVKVAFNKQPVKDCLCEVLSKNNKTMAKFAEPTKFPHVTYFFNGGNEQAFKGEDWYKIPPKNVETFDKAPEMSAIELAEKFTKEVIENRYDFVLCNIANGDMVGHTGNLKATIKACEIIDKSLKIMIEHIKKIGGEALICADHGNAEQMIFRNNVCTTHSNNPVRLIYFSTSNKNNKSKVLKGSLKDIAPTILKLMNIEIPKVYTGKNLVLTTKK